MREKGNTSFSSFDRLKATYLRIDFSRLVNLFVQTCFPVGMRGGGGGLMYGDWTCWVSQVLIILITFVSCKSSFYSCTVITKHVIMTDLPTRSQLYNRYECVEIPIKGRVKFWQLLSKTCILTYVAHDIQNITNLCEHLCSMLDFWDAWWQQTYQVKSLFSVMCACSELRKQWKFTW